MMNLNSGVGRIDHLGMPRTNDTTRDPTMPPLEDLYSADSTAAKLDQLLAAFAKFESRLDETERIVDELRQPSRPDPDPQYGQPGTTPRGLPHRQPELHHPRSTKPAGDTSTHPTYEAWHHAIPASQYHHMNPNQGWSTQGHMNPNQGWSTQGSFQQPYTAQPRPPSCWDLPGYRPQHGPPQFGQPTTRQPPYWDTPPIRATHGYPAHDQIPRVRMDPPRFDGSDAANWISRVQYYFDHLMMPGANRLHYVVMMFDPPASDWVFNYCANNTAVTWHEFLKDVHRRFDPQCHENYA